MRDKLISKLIKSEIRIDSILWDRKDLIMFKFAYTTNFSLNGTKSFEIDHHMELC